MRKWWDRAGIVEDRGLLTICLGMLAGGFDFEPVMMSLRRLESKLPEIRLIFWQARSRDIQRSAYGLMVCISRAMCRELHIKTMMDRSDVALALCWHTQLHVQHTARSANISQPDYRC